MVLMGGKTLKSCFSKLWKTCYWFLEMTRRSVKPSNVFPWTIKAERCIMIPTVFRIGCHVMLYKHMLLSEWYVLFGLPLTCTFTTVVFPDQLLDEQRLSKHNQEEITSLKSSLEAEQTRLKTTLQTLESVKSKKKENHWVYKGSYICCHWI